MARSEHASVINPEPLPFPFVRVKESETKVKRARTVLLTSITPRVSKRVRSKRKTESSKPGTIRSGDKSGMMLPAQWEPTQKQEEDGQLAFCRSMQVGLGSSAHNERERRIVLT